jgi:PAS domain S-box-containing protein
MSEHKSRKQEMLQLFIERSPAAFCLVDEEGRWHLMNRVWEKMLGWKSEEMEGKRAEKQPCSTEESLNALKELWKDVVDKKIEAYRDIPYKHKEGHMVYVRTWESPLPKGEGRLAVCSDVTEEHRSTPSSP